VFPVVTDCPVPYCFLGNSQEEKGVNLKDNSAQRRSTSDVVQDHFGTRFIEDMARAHFMQVANNELLKTLI
jgi:hypothetical protein